MNQNNMFLDLMRDIIHHYRNKFPNKAGNNSIVTTIPSSFPPPPSPISPALHVR